MKGPALLALGAACLEFLLSVHHRGPESLRLIREAHQRRAVLVRESWYGDMNMAWSRRESLDRWSPSMRMGGKAGLLNWGSESSLDWAVSQEGGSSWISSRLEGWVQLPLLGMPGAGKGSQEGLELGRLETQLIMDRNRLVLKALEVFGSWTEALERREVWHRRREFLSQLRDLRLQDPESTDPSMVLDSEMSLQEAEFHRESQDILAAEAENLCRVLAGGDAISAPESWSWKNSGYLPLPASGDTALTLRRLRAALKRDAAAQEEARIDNGPFLRIWTRVSTGTALIQDGGTWKWHSLPGESALPVQAGADFSLPLTTPPAGREEELRLLIFRGEEEAAEQEAEARKRRIEALQKEAEVFRKRAAGMEILLARSRILLSTGEISPEDHEKAVVRQEDILLHLGKIHRAVNLEIMGLRSLSGSLGSWLQKEADYEGSVCNP